MTINREILRLAVPNILSNVSVPLISSVDTALMGRMSELHLGAIGLGAIIFNFIYWNFGFLRMGTTGISAQAYGAENRQRMVHTLLRALGIAWGLALLIVALQVPIGNLAFQLLEVNEAQRPLVETYWHIRVWDAPATLGLLALMGWFFGMQNAKYPLILTVVIAAVNTSLSWYLVARLGWSVRGVAYGTLVAQYTGLVLGFVLFAHRYRFILPEIRRHLILQTEELQQFFAVNRDIFLRTLFLTAAFGFFYRESSALGVTLLAVNTVFLQFVNWMSYAIDGFAYAAESLVGKYVGAQQPARVWSVIRRSFGWGLGFALLFSGVYWFGGDALFGIFSSEADLLAEARPYLIWVVLFPVLSFPCYLFDGIYIGLTASRSMLLSAALAFAAFLVSYLLLRDWGNHGLWTAMLVFMLGRGIFQGLLLRSRGLQLT